MQYYPFDSQNKLYRGHIGAAAAGEKLLLRLLLHTDAHCHNAYLRLNRDGSDYVEEIELSRKESLESYIFYDCEIALDEGLYWYCFRYTSDYGEFYVTKTDTSLGIVSRDGGCWQQTVYADDFTTPDWLDGGIIYQIFPDRFYNSKKEKQNVPEDRFLCTDWHKNPEHRQNVGICSLGNDYYGGDLAGIGEKLPYLKELGVSCIYLNPIFEAHSNHRYNTADYMKIDTLLGTNEDLEKLCKKAEEIGISIILDGVFSHTGDDSIYFNRYHRYPESGAFDNENSPYRSWYSFGNFENGYASWWGVPSLPEVNENNPEFTEFITGENGVLRHWLRHGIKGWRLDVADELPDAFLESIRIAIKAENPDAFLLGEVWEDASNKISYGARRKFLQGRQLDSVMNYPFANAIIDFVCGGDAAKLCGIVSSILENYPPCAIKLLMNHIGTHDTARAITQIARYGQYTGDREWQSHQTLSNEEYARAVQLLKLAAIIQYTLPGVPSLYYGDEVGMQGYGDPFCRGAYPWDNEDTSLLEFYKALGACRRSSPAFKGTSYRTITAQGGHLVFERESGEHKALIAVNRSDELLYLTLDEQYKKPSAVFGEKPDDGRLILNKNQYSIITV